MKIYLTKWVYSFLMVSCLATLGMAQKTISGIVKDANSNEALIGASVLVKGTSNGTITDFDGAFNLRANEGDVIIVSYTGFDDFQTTIGSASFYTVMLNAGKLLDEVVVVGYGSQKSKEITSAVVSVGREDFNKGPIADPLQLLQGKVAGLQVYNRGGDPNRNSVIRLRGISTVGANVEPLVVIDGIIGASLQNVDPNDIESIDVLKDGSASAIYGSRGSSGVIIITTKKGSKKTSGISMSYSGQYGISNRMRTIKTMNTEEFLAAGGANLGATTNWIDEITRTGSNFVHGISAEGGFGNSSVRASVNLRQQNGILQNSGFDQYNARLNFNTKALNDKLNIDFNTSFTEKDQNFGFNEAMRYAIMYNPSAPVFAGDGLYKVNPEQFGGYFETLGLFDSFNPVSIINQNKNLGKRREFNYGANFGYNILDNLTANFRIARQTNTSSNRQYYPTTSFFRGNATSPTRKGRADFFNDDYSFNLYELYGTHLSEIGSSNLTLTGGYSFQQANYSSQYLQIGDFPNNDIDFSNRIQSSQDLLNRNFIQANSSASPDERIIAFFGRANYSYDNGIFLNASIRREGSSKLGTNNRWGWFPAFGAGVDLNKYLSLNNVDLLKLRVGYGVTGALPGPNGLSKATRNIINGEDGSVSTTLARAANDSLRWEQKGELNLGLEFKSGRLGATLDLYDRTISDFILERVVDVSVFGTNRRFENAGVLNTKGIELGINYDVLRGGKNSYTTGLVLSTYNTILREYVNEKEVRANLGAPGQNDTRLILVKEGSPIGQIWGPVFTGVENGEPVFKDVNGDDELIVSQDKALLDNVDFEVLGKGIPTFELGWNNSLNLGGWQVNAFFRGAFGHSLVNTFRAFYEPRLSTQTSYNFVNTSLAEPDLKSARFSSLYVERADFFKLDNLTISRAINLGSSSAIKNLNLSLTAQNLFVLTKYTGSDPEPSLVYYGAVDNGAAENLSNPDVLSPGIDSRNNYFTARTFTLGINFNF